MVKMTIWTKKMGRSPMVWARNVAEGRYIEKALCLARTARPENAAVVSDRAMSDGTGVSDATREHVRRQVRASARRCRTHRARSRRWYHRAERGPRWSGMSGRTADRQHRSSVSSGFTYRSSDPSQNEGGRLTSPQCPDIERPAPRRMESPATHHWSPHRCW